MNFHYEKLENEVEEAKKETALEEKATSEENMNAPKEIVLDNINLTIPKGKVTAFVG